MEKTIIKVGFLTILAVAALGTKTASAAVPASEREALVFFYTFTGGASWTDNSGWLTGDPCDDGWIGVGCNVDDTSVQSLFLPNNNLTGQLHSTIGNLPNLTNIRLGQNSVGGLIPTEVGALTQLTLLNLSTNTLVGPIPVELTSLPALQFLNLSSNNLTSLPATWSASLDTVLLDANQIGGGIPAGIGAMINLTTLTVSSNRLEGFIPPEIGMLSSLTTLALHRNRLDGPLPNQMGNLTLLQFLRLDSNQLAGELPGSLTNLVNLNPAGTSLFYNALFTDDGALDAFLNAATGGNWSSSQTIAPSNLHKTNADDNCITMEWDIIEYTSDGGNYQVTYALNPGGPFNNPIVNTTDKFDNDHTQCGFGPGTIAYFIVRTITPPHAGNENVVVSDWSPPVGMSTTGLPPGVIDRDGFEDLPQD